MSAVLQRKIVSSDSHVIEPPEMWREYITPKMRDRAPRIEHAKDDDLYWIDGLKALPVRTLSTAGIPSEITKTYRRWDAPRLKGGWDPVIRVKDLERDRIDAEVMTSGLLGSRKGISLPEHGPYDIHVTVNGEPQQLLTFRCLPPRR